MSQPHSGAVARLPNVEGLRAVAALAVLAGHAYALNGRQVPLSANTIEDAVLLIAPTGVWLFFALSGLVIGRPFVRALVTGTDAPSLGPYAVRRVARIYPLYLVCAVAVLAILGLRSMGAFDLLAHITLLHNLVPGRQQAFIAATWTLTLEVLFYALIPAIGILVARRRWPVSPALLARWIVTSGLASVVWMFAFGALASTFPRVSLYGRLFLPSMWSAFCPGLLLALYHEATPSDVESSRVLTALDRLRTRRRLALGIGAGAAATGIVTSFADASWGPVAYVWSLDVTRLFWTAAYGVLVLRASFAPTVQTRLSGVFNTLGEWSYGIYLIHATVLTILWAHDGGSLLPMQRGGVVAFFVHLAFLLAVTLPLAWLSWRCVERPAMQLAARVRRSLALAGTA